MMFGISLAFTSCKKDETAKVPPTVTINDGTKTKSLPVSTTSIDIKIAASASTNQKIKTLTIEKAIAGQPTIVLFTATPNAKDYVKTYTDVLSGQAAGQIITYTVKATDDQESVTSETFTVTLISVENVDVSSVIQLGAQSNTTVLYKFLGIANNFATYTAGVSGTATANSSKIDFVYYYGATDKNAFAAPTNTDGAQVIWNTEITGWATKNDTKFKVTSITAAQFDQIKDVTKVDDSFKTIDFASGTLSKVVSLANNDVYAFLTASGKKGLVKFVTTATDNTGAVTLFVISQK